MAQNIDDRWFLANNNNGREIYMRKSAVVAFMPHTTFGFTQVWTEDGSASGQATFILQEDPKELFETIFKSRLDALSDEGGPLMDG